MKLKWKMPIALGVMSIFLSACTSHAQTEAELLADVPPPDELRFISADDSSSTCIGEPKTPMCAVETIMACFARMDKTLCEKVGVKGKVYLGKEVRTIQYRINKATVLTQNDMEREDIVREFATPPDWWQPGFVDFTVFRPNETDGTCSISNCRFMDNPSGPSGDECCNYTYIAYPANYEWHIKTWSWWGDH